MKKISLLALGVALFALSLIQADDGFEIYNKAPYPIWYRLASKGALGSGLLHSLNPKETERIPLDTSYEAALSIYKTEPQGQLPDKLHTFTTGKTIYVTWNESLRPQTGQGLGILGLTKSGLSLKNNVKQYDIKSRV